MNELIPILTQYNLDGIDLDLEAGVADSTDHYTALNSLNSTLKAHGYIISMAPQCSQIYPQKYPPVIDNTWNTYMPLYSTMNLDFVDIIATQFYNNCPCEYNMPICGPEQTYLEWIQKIQQEWHNTYTYQGVTQSYTAIFSDSALKKILIGKPGATTAASSGYQAPETLVNIYKELVTAGKYLGGFMYWSAEYDTPSFTFANTLDQAFWADA